ncbi:pyridoxamine 5-phosphate oxidase [Izhakiella australiensis]|uniref:Pyridoxamine 5-phosphate oxidase n=1 Tax=Izhakiella australiensis TaxID=1926881 RepID=A0A1S8YG69_9GAMM|nr:pyridoxamine 5'-phosphate oxidase family protein [Izhakiella australiensis]OON38071.1 pyridoxamine 5-phosphate oxidase [Izhakiella australiensis]
MSFDFLDIAITPEVRAAQAAMGSELLWQHRPKPTETARFSAAEDSFIARRDSFYIATISQTGWPYVQHRGGPPGFLKLIDPHTLAFADYRGNRQYITTGNLSSSKRACLILVDYPRRTRLKIYAHVETLALDDEPALLEQVSDSGYRAKPERLFRLHLDAFDWNCPQHITPRYSAQEITNVIQPLRDRLAQLETENAGLRARLTNQGASL